LPRLPGSDLPGARLTWATLPGPWLCGPRLAGTRLRRAWRGGAGLAGTCLAGTGPLRSGLPGSCLAAGLAGATLRGAGVALVLAGLASPRLAAAAGRRAQLVGDVLRHRRGMALGLHPHGGQLGEQVL
jgi:hypothetical protein